MTDASVAIAAGLARLWIKFLPEIQERLLVLADAEKALRGDSLTQAGRDEAHAAAHKLAGILGTFGLPRGTELARKAELLFADEVNPEKAEVLSSWIEEIRALITERNP